MSLSKLTDNLNIIGSLPDKPSMTAEELKQSFDEASGLIKEYLNTVLTSEIDALISGIQSGKIDVSKIVNDLTTGGANKVASAEMVKSLNNSKANTSHTHTKSQISDFSHNHDDRYYTETEVNTKLNGKANTSHTHTKSQISDFSHTHDDRYYTETEINTKLNGKANTSHTHTTSQVTGLKSGATTKISSGTSNPSGGDNGDVYIQYFT